ncbi:MAG: hypothetical protein HQL70_01505 [Magnetococcales bacterium]|nr:hypothetical protein [Magnetococcales bacterium]
MSDRSKKRDGATLTTGVAINRVLEAEQSALLAIAKSRQDGEAIILSAQHKGVEIAARADQRISRIIKKRSKKNKKFLNKSKHSNNNLATQNSPEIAKIDLEKIVEELAAKLTHGEPLTVAAKN